MTFGIYLIFQLLKSHFFLETGQAVRKYSLLVLVIHHRCVSHKFTSDKPNTTITKNNIQIITMMNDFQMQNYDQLSPNTVKRPRLDLNFGNQFDVSAYQSPNLANNNSRQWRRSSLAFFADASPVKFDTSYDSNEIFGADKVLGMKRNTDVTNGNSSLSPVDFPFQNFRNKMNNLPNVVRENESRTIQKGISMPPFCGNTVTPPPEPASMNQQNQYQFNMAQMMMGNNNDKKRKEMSAPLPPQRQKIRFRSHQAESWMEKYEELLDYRLSNGHCLVPNQYPANPSLAEWVKRQRYQYKLKGLGKHSSMSDDRVTALEKLGFVWNSHDAVWEERLKELKLYKSMFGNTNVPSKYEANPQLAIWIKRQRRQYKFLTEGKPSTMTPYRVEKLREINFSWSGRKPKVSR